MPQCAYKVHTIVHCFLESICNPGDCNMCNNDYFCSGCMRLSAPHISFVRNVSK